MSGFESLIYFTIILSMVSSKPVGAGMDAIRYRTCLSGAPWLRGLRVGLDPAGSIRVVMALGNN